MSRIKLDSVQDFSRKGYNLRIICLKCHREVEASAVLMAVELTRIGGSRLIDRLEKRMRCRVCNHRGARIEPCDAQF